MNSRRMTLIIALVLAIGAGWLILSYVASVQRSSALNNQPREILVAAQDIPARVPITPAMLTKATRPAAAIEPDAMTDESKAVGAISLITIPAGGTITLSKVGHPSDMPLPVRLQPGMRAVSIPIDKVKAVSGLIEPGDRVDVIAIPPKTGDNPPAAVTILRGILVLAVGPLLENTSATPAPENQVSTTITLAVTPKQADLIAMADVNTNLRLALRSPREPLNSEPTEALNFPAGGSAAVASAPQPQPTPDYTALLLASQQNQSRQPVRSAPAQTSSGVVVIDGDHYSSGNP